ncbi:MAG TPA: site-specific integrase, partial [Phycisphaerae bacterium]|nr:site-specific integrase [Phycisphaerae bacterium]
MFVHKTTYRDRKGRTQETSKFYVDFSTATGTRCRLPAFADRKASEGLGRMIERMVALRAAGESLPLDMQRWLEALPDSVRTALAKFGLIDGARLAAGRTLAEHLDGWRAFLLSSGNTEKHVDTSLSHVRKIAKAGRFITWTDVTAAAVVDYLNEQRTSGTSARTVNSHLQSVKAFAKWMCKDGRATASPLAYLTGQNARADRRRVRRALAADEISALLAATQQEPERHGMTGQERALLYRLAIETGLRASELASLSRESFSLAANPPTVTVAAGYSKHRRDDTLPLREATAAELKPVVGKLLPGERIFRLQACPRYAEMLHADLDAARAAWLEEAKAPKERERREESDFLKAEDSAGRVIDFHSLRGTCASLLAAANVHPRVAQSLMRHSTVDLTMSYYTSVYGEQQVD